MGAGWTVFGLIVSAAVFAAATLIARRPVELGRIRPPTTPFLFVSFVSFGLFAVHLAHLAMGR